MSVSLMSGGGGTSAESGATIAAAVWPDTNRSVFLQYNRDYFVIGALRFMLAVNAGPPSVGVTAALCV